MFVCVFARGRDANRQRAELTLARSMVLRDRMWRHLACSMDILLSKFPTRPKRPGRDTSTGTGRSRVIGIYDTIFAQSHPLLRRHLHNEGRTSDNDRLDHMQRSRIEHVTERVEKIVGRGKGGTILVHVGTNNTDKEGTTAIVEKYRKLLKKTKQARLGQIILSGILPVCGNRIQGYRNSKRMAVNGMVERLCQEEDVGYVDMWDSFVGNEELYFRDGLHLSGKGAAVLAEGLSGAVASGLGKVRYLN